MSQDYLPRPQRSSSGWVVALAVAVLLLILLGGGALVGLKYYHAMQAGERAAQQELRRAIHQAERAALKKALIEKSLAEKDAHRRAQQQAPSSVDD